jgi:hypothetical protein
MPPISPSIKSPWENYGPHVYAEQDITVGFYCERADDAPTEWSSHSYGVAIDLNPRENPFRDVKKGWWPPTSAVFAPPRQRQGQNLSLIRRLSHLHPPRLGLGRILRG